MQRKQKKARNPVARALYEDDQFGIKKVPGKKNKTRGKGKRIEQAALKGLTDEDFYDEYDDE